MNRSVSTRKAFSFININKKRRRILIEGFRSPEIPYTRNFYDDKEFKRESKREF